MRIFNRRLLYTLLTVLVISGVIALIAIKGPLSPTPVKTSHLQQSDLHPAVFGIGTVEAQRSYSIGSTRPGRVLKLLVDHGDTVIKGQLLGQMDPVDLSARLKSAQLLIKKIEQSVESSRAAVDETKTRALQAHREHLRYQKLFAQKQISQEVAEGKQTDDRAAEDKVREARAALSAAKHDLERAQEDLRALQAQYNDLKLLSPSSGLIIAREVEPGSVIVAGTPILRMIDPLSLWVRTRIDQAKSGQIHEGQMAEIQLKNLPGKILKGQVKRIELIADSLTEERWVDVAFEQIPNNLSIGMLANVTIELPVVKQAFWLPGATIVYQKGKAGVWRVIGGKAQFAPVKLGVQTLEGKTQILDGIKAKDKVIYNALKPIKEDARVKVQQ